MNKKCPGKIVLKRLRSYLLLGMLLSAVLNFQSCSYSFTGSSVPSHLKTISISVFSDKSGSGEIDLNRKLTNRIIQRFINDNTLLISSRTNSDSILDGTIVSLRDEPNVLSGAEKNLTRRITITVNAVYKDLVKKRQVFERKFSNYGDYTVGGDIISVRSQAIETAIDRISEDILLGVVSNW